MDKDTIKPLRKLGQQYAYTSIQMHEAIARKAGLSGTDHKYLGFLIECGAMTAGEWAALSGLTTGAVTGLIDRFEKKKLVKRKPAADDRRKVVIEPDTKNIMALLEPLYRSFRSQTEQLISSFSAKDRKVIEAYMTQTITLMQETTGKLLSKQTKAGI